ncbi:MAG: LamG-like jellyroll fold domain-containing protein [Sedimentisphaerales bacterium]
MLNKRFIGGCVVASCLMLCMVFVANAAVIGEWNMNEGTGSVVADSSGNGYDFSPVGSGIGAGYSWGTGHENGGLTAAAANTSYLHATVADNKIQYQMTVEAWIKPNGAAADGSQIVDLAWAFGFATVDAGTRLRFITYSNGGWLDTYAPCGSPTLGTGIYDGGWHHVMGVMDGIRDINGNISHSLFIDGVLAHKETRASATDVVVGFNAGQTGTDLYIGTNAWIVGTPSQCYYGDIDQVRITNVPEPVTISMLALGGLAMLRRRKA